MISSRQFLVCALAIGLVATVSTFAEHTRTWRQSEFSEFERGTANGVAIRSDGKLMPAPKFTSFSDPNLAYLWALRMDSRGRLYAAGGSNAKVLRLDDPVKPTTVFESGELAAQAMVFDSHDNLYVGTSPDGKVYKLTPEGQKSVFFDPKTKYIWALAMDSQGTMFVATGDKGEVFAVTPDGKGQVFYQSDERHARSIAFDQKGNLLIGTDPNGLVLRVAVVRKNSQAMPESGSAFVVYETSKKEVTSLLTDDRKYLCRVDRRKTAWSRHCADPQSAAAFGATASCRDAAGKRHAAVASAGVAAQHFVPVHFIADRRRGSN